MQDSRDMTIEILINKHVGFVHALAVKYAPAPGLAYDVAQQVFLEFLKKKDQWDLDQDVKPLLAKMTRIIAMRFWQEKNRRMTPDMRDLAEYVRKLAETEDVEPILEEKRTALSKCLDKLSERGQRLVRGRYYFSSSCIEIAESLGMTPGAVRKALFHLRKKLRACVELQLGRGGL